MDSNLFFSLLDKYRDGTATDAEKALIEEYYRRLETTGTTELSPEEEAALKEVLYKQITNTIRSSESKVVSLKRKYSMVAAAAVLLLMLGSAGYMWLSHKPTITVSKTPAVVAKQPDLPPGKDAAVLTLADGSKIILDSAKGTITQQGNVTVLNKMGQLSYAPSAKNGNQHEVVYNTVTTARGNQYQLVLADGTKVWLNSASSLRFPTAFTGKQREVELDGEGYFEVTKNAAQPFHVKTHTQDVEVLGTHFNVNAYNDEEAVKTTLLEGKVKVASGSSSAANTNSEVILQPGEQAVLSPSPLTTNHSPFTINHSPDIDQVMAWKNGWFEFDNTDLKMIMRQISRWYDVDIVYEIKTTNEKYGGRLSRSLNLSGILKMLENYGVHFRLNGKTLTVL